MLPREEMLKGVENRQDIAHIIDKAEQALKNWEVVLTDFVSPPVWMEAQRVLGNLTEVSFLAWGGFPQAERQRLGLARLEIPFELTQIQLVGLDISGNFLFDPASHRDFLGAILGTGIVREKVGDVIVLGERGAQVIVVPEIVDFLQASLNQVRSVPVKLTTIDLQALKVQLPKKKEINTVEASLRLDAVASAGFGISRSKMSQAITSGDVRVNWKEITQASHTVQSGDLIAFGGKGRLEVGEIAVTKKERYRVQLTRYL
jgi:photosystem II S4 domain protein